MKGTGVDVDHELGAPQRLLYRRPVGIPNVLADRQPNAHAPNREQRLIGTADIEMSSLVERPVVGQPLLDVLADDLAAGADRNGVGRSDTADIIDGFLVIGVAHNGHAIRRRSRHAAQRFDVVLEETLPDQQVLGGIPGHRKFGKHRDLCTLCTSGFIRLNDGVDIALQISNHRVDLT